MKAIELRIGNWVFTNKTEYQIELSDFSDWYNDHNSHQYGEFIHPIPLTKEWLLKFGFKAIDERGYSKEILIKDDRYTFNFVIFKTNDGYDNDVCLYVIKYVHQLQNLYFALTGEELTIN
jgi:hypothetical protein